MSTVAVMSRRMVILATGVLLGFALALGAARVASAWSLLPNRELNRSIDYVRDVLQMVNTNYVDADKATYPALAKTALHGMVESLDPHSEFMEAREFGELEEQLSGDFSGIGIQVEMRKGRVFVITPIANSPGERAGIQRGDEILAVDGKGVEKGWTMDVVVDRLRGKPNTKVSLDLYRAKTGGKFQLTLEREMIVLESVRPPLVLDEHVGYVEITEFSDHTAEEFDRAVESLLKEGVDSLVIDLRDNPGGLLDAAVAVAEPFFQKGELIVSTRGRKADDNEEYRAEGDGGRLTLPVAVLINSGSASAAEVLTGALKDTGRAIIVGERSYGKGSVQSVIKLKNGEGLRLTTARYFTPAGVSIHEKGIVPNVEVIATAEEDSKLRLQRARADLAESKEFKERFGFEPIEDRQLEAALDVLQGIKLLEQRRTGTIARVARRR